MASESTWSYTEFSGVGAKELDESLKDLSKTFKSLISTRHRKLQNHTSLESVFTTSVRGSVLAIHQSSGIEAMRIPPRKGINFESYITESTLRAGGVDLTILIRGQTYDPVDGVWKELRNVTLTCRALWQGSEYGTGGTTVNAAQ